MDWAAWSRESVALMRTRMAELLARHELAFGSPYRWDLEAGTIAIGSVTFRLVVVGTVASDSFLWSWANDAVPELAKVDIERVRQFGIDNALPLLVEPCTRGGLAEGKECLAIAGRILDADGAWISQIDAGHILFALHERS